MKLITKIQKNLTTLFYLDFFENQEIYEGSGFMEEVKITGFEIKLKLYIMSIAWCLKGEKNILKNQHLGWCIDICSQENQFPALFPPLSKFLFPFAIKNRTNKKTATTFYIKT